MPQPTMSDVHVNVPLTQISIAYLQDPRGFIADDVFPNIPVQKPSDRYYVYPKDAWNRIDAKPRAPGSESAGSGWTVDNTPFYMCTVYAIHHDVDDQIRATADAVLNLDRDATEYVTRQLQLKKEKLWVVEFYTTGVWTGAVGTNAGADGADIVGNATGTAANQVKFWDAGGSTPIQDIWKQTVGMAGKTGFKPNTLVFSPQVLEKLVNHADVLDRIKYTQRGLGTADILAGLFNVERVLIPWVSENSAAEGANVSQAFMYGKNALLCYSAPAPSLMTPSAGYTFSWSGLFGAGALGQRVSSFRMEHLRSDRVEAEMAFDHKVVAADLGMFFSNVVQ
jgi:hypothetical protein